MAQLAIKGHETRGAEVIALLEMLGGINAGNLYGDLNYAYYFINNNYINAGYVLEHNSKQYLSYSLEEFEEKFPYKVGDKVIIKVTNQEAIIDKVVWCCDTITYRLKYNGCLEGNWRAEHLQPYKEETMDGKYNVEKYLKVWGETEKGLEVFVNDNFELKEDNGKFYIIKKQPQYPKTYEECCKVLMGETNFQDFSLVLTKLSMRRSEENSISPEPPYISSINTLYKILICRDACWKIAGEQMGLGKPWKPDWSSANSIKFILYTCENKIHTGISLINNDILVFPTEEMRDAFYENFKELIEQCKELL